MNRTNKLLRDLPAVGVLLESPEWARLLARFDRALVRAVLEKELDNCREQILKGNEQVPDSSLLQSRVEQILAPLRSTGPRPVLNATGIIIHTNLGRAPLADRAVNYAVKAAGYCDLEFNLPEGIRDSRHHHVEELLCRITGAEAAMVVNNNASAVLLALAAIARGGEAVISRGQLVEIGGSFRIPEVMEQSGVSLREVGTTNKTYLEDYRRAIGPGTKVLIRVHPSNYRVVGFHHEVSLEDMVILARQHSLPVLDDLGSGVLVDLTKYGIDEPTVQQSVAAGTSLVCFSGDKLLGGPQCGIVVGSSDWINTLKKHPLARALRSDKITIAALAATLSLYLSPDGWRQIPVLAMITEPVERVAERAASLGEMLKGLPLDIFVGNDLSPVGGGALPTFKLETKVVRILPRNMSPSELARRLRLGNPPLITRVADERVVLDLRTLPQDELERTAEVIISALAGERG
jgi:L-seryl-tRNA(Ser) seleniumtransferase